MARSESMSRSLVKNLEDVGGYWTVGGTLVDYEVELLKKLAGDFDEFRRQIYLHSEPSVDITKVESVDCRKHTIFLSEFVKIRKQFGLTPLDVFSWMLNSGPKVIE